MRIIIKQYTCSVSDKVILIPTKKYRKHANGKTYRIPLLGTVTVCHILPGNGRTVSVFFFGFATERLQRRRPISDVSADNVTPGFRLRVEWA
jgi:hypothetical protein